MIAKDYRGYLAEKLSSNPHMWVSSQEARDGQRKRVLVQVKSGHVKSGDIRDLVDTINREQAQIGVFITLEESTCNMNTEVVSAGYYHSTGFNRDYPRIQILSIAELLRGAEVKMPPEFETFKKA